MEVKLGDCWTSGGYHWFCKIITHGSLLSRLGAETYMVKYEENGFRVIPVDEFFELHPDAELYLREGKHKGG